MEISHNNIKLTSVELASLWNSYIFESMVHHVFTCFLQHVEDPEIKSYLEFVQKKSRDHVNDYIAIFKAENVPIPRGTTSEDINLDAPRLFTDVFYINYIKNVAKFALTQFAISYSESIRDDIRKMFLNHLQVLENVDKWELKLCYQKALFFVHQTSPLQMKYILLSKKTFLLDFLVKIDRLVFWKLDSFFTIPNTMHLEKHL